MLFLQHLAMGGPVASNEAGFNAPYKKLPDGGTTPVPASAPPATTPPASDGSAWAQEAKSLVGRLGGSLGAAGMQETGTDIHGGPFVQDQFNSRAPISSLSFNSPYTKMLLDEANGNKLGAAQLQLQNATDANIKQAMALGQTHPSGGSYGASLRNILSAQAGVQQQAAGQSAATQLEAERLGAENALSTGKLSLQQAQGNQQSVNSANALNAQASLQNAQMAQGGWNQAGQAAATALSSIPAVTNYLTSGSTGTSGTSAGAGNSGGTTTGSGSYGGLGNPQTSGPVGGSGGDGPDGPIPYSDGLRAYRGYAAGGEVGGGDVYGDDELGVNINGDVARKKLDTSGYSAGPDSEYVAPLAAPSYAIAPKLDLNPNDAPQSSASKLGDKIAGSIPVVGQIYSGLKAIGSLFNAGGQVQPSALQMLTGGPVPGRAQVAGNSPKNDTVPAELSPGEVVLPRSVTEDDDAPDKAKAFMEAVRKSKAPKPTFGDVLQSHRNLQGRVAQLEALCRGGMA